MSVDTAVERITEQVTGTATETAPNASQATQEARTGTADHTEWYDSLDDTTRPLVDAYHAGETAKLRAAIEDERKQRKELAKQIKELASKPVDDTAWKAKIEAISAQASEAQQRAAFYEGAASQEDLAARRYPAAYKIAKIDGLIDDDGAVDWKALREQHDYLFSAPVVAPAGKGNAGSGLGQKPQKPSTMNDLIRGERICYV